MARLPAALARLSGALRVVEEAEAFQVSCPLPGARITVTTTGLDLDPDEYRVMADGSDRGAIASNGTILTKLDPGNRTIGLAGLESNCAIEGFAVHTVTISDR